jgi:DNA (cytosine-5)-methyltransferase 1
MRPALKRGKWNLSELKDIPKNGYKVFSTFHCGGGSTMGYKLSGFEVIGGVEIDPEMMRVYKANHSPKYPFLMGVQDFNKIPRDQIPKELFGIDILDGSPPCSSFSMAGSREKAWGEKKQFREGQAVQVLDDLFFHFIETARILQPKVVIAENVKGLLMGKAKGYVKQIVDLFNLAGYDVQLFLLNAAFMGVPQRRERTFFVARRRDLNMPKISFNFTEPTVSINEAMGDESAIGALESKNTRCYAYWQKCKRGFSFASVHETGSYFSKIRLDPNEPSNTITGHSRNDLFHWNVCASLNDAFFKRVQTFPEDYNFLNLDAGYICGMSVPPFMLNRVSAEVKIQLLDTLKSKVSRAEEMQCVQ